MILTPDNEFCVLPDACVLLPMPLCDTLLRSAEEPSFFRIVWSEEILNEVRKGLLSEKFVGKWGDTRYLYPAGSIIRDKLRTVCVA